jgi:hypothetical protein
LSEVTRGNGAMCGSAFIDQNMSILIKSKLNNQDIPSCMFEMMMETFIERIKVSSFIRGKKFILINQ